MRMVFNKLFNHILVGFFLRWCCCHKHHCWIDGKTKSSNDGLVEIAVIILRHTEKRRLPEIEVHRNSGVVMNRNSGSSVKSSIYVFGFLELVRRRKKTKVGQIENLKSSLPSFLSLHFSSKRIPKKQFEYQTTSTLLHTALTDYYSRSTGWVRPQRSINHSPPIFRNIHN